MSKYITLKADESGLRQAVALGLLGQNVLVRNYKMDEEKYDSLPLKAVQTEKGNSHFIIKDHNVDGWHRYMLEIRVPAELLEPQVGDVWRYNEHSHIAEDEDERDFVKVCHHLVENEKDMPFFDSPYYTDFELIARNPVGIPVGGE